MGQNGLKWVEKGQKHIKTGQNVSKGEKMVQNSTQQLKTSKNVSKWVTKGLAVVKIGG